MKIVQQMWAKFHGIVENVLDAMEKGLDYVSFQEGLREQLNGLGREVEKSILTPFGKVEEVVAEVLCLC